MENKIFLSIIVPVLNEKSRLEGFLDNISSQRVNKNWEIIIVDGGSNDGTKNYCDKLVENYSLPIVCSCSRRGRAVQMNQGAMLANGRDLLFLHSDTKLMDTSILKQAIDFMQVSRVERVNDSVAGHFSLIFERATKGHELAYYFYAAKTSLNLPGTINGDQGFYISKEFFESLGRYDESLAYMEDARLANNVDRIGRWVCLPGNIVTSARRFETEGLFRRQIINAIMCNMQALGEIWYFENVDDIYPQQGETKSMSLWPYFYKLHCCSLRKGWRHVFRFWHGVGFYAANNFWQLAFFFDCLTSKRKGKTPKNCDTVLLKYYKSYIEIIISNNIGALIYGIVIVILFYAIMPFAWLFSRPKTKQ